MKRNAQSRPGAISLFLVLLFGSWALAVWFRPIGPPVGGVYWGSFLAAVVAVALLLAVAGSLPRSLHQKSREELRGVEIKPLLPGDEKLQEERAEAAVAASLGTIFWLLIIIAVIAIIAHYALPRLGSG